MNKMKKNENIGKSISSTAKLYWLSFAIPFIMGVIICISEEVYPFGENCILHVDMYHQYEPFFTELMTKLKEGGSLLHSWNIGLGSDFVSLFAYYLASPFNWLLLLCPQNHVIEFMTILILVKMGLCSAAFSVFLRNHYKKVDYAMAVVGTVYAMSGYMAAYNWDIMWLDCLILAPIVLLGLERLVKEGKGGLYCASLALSILTNFYISIMICIFQVIYFILLMLEEKQSLLEKAKAAGRFTLYSLLAGGMGAILLIPEAIILSYSGSSGVSFPDTMEFYFNIISELSRHSFGVAVYTARDHWPNLYCGAAMFLFLILYLLNREIPRKKKIARCILIVFFWVSFSNNILDFIWHGLHFPDSLPGRQSFLYIFLLLALAYETYEKRQGNQILHVAIAAVASCLFLCLSYFYGDLELVSAENLIITGFLLIGYGLLLAMLYTSNADGRNMAMYIFGILVLLEVYINFDITGFSVTSRTSYTKNWESYDTLLAQVEKEDNDFYRIERMERLTKNDAAIYGYRSATIFSSLMNVNVGNFYRKLGMEGGKNFYSYSGSTALTAAMFAVKYEITGSPYEDSPLRTLVQSDGENYVYKNNYTLPLGYMVQSDLEENWNPQYGIPVSNLNALAALLGGQEVLLDMGEGTETAANSGNTTIMVREDGYYYATYEDTSVTNITVTAGERVRKFNKCDHGYLLDLGWCEAGETIVLTNTTVDVFPVTVYQLNLDTFQTAFDTLNQQTLSVENYTDTYVKGTIHVTEPGNLILSIPYEDGWSVWVDGVRTESREFMEALIELPLDTGSHVIELRYETPGLKEGAAISGSCLAVFLGIIFWKRRWRIHEN